jgi:hypothetical protein
MKMKTCLAAAALLSSLSAVLVASAASAEEFYQEGSYEGRTWISGGVGINERQYLLDHFADKENVKLEFAVADGEYLGDINVLITKPDGEVVMKAFSSGPWFMTKLPAGTYRVRVSGFDQSFEKTIEVPAEGLHSVVFNEWTKPDVAEETPGPTY